MRSIQKLDLSSNNLKTLPGPEVLQEMRSLRFFFVHNNQISSWQTLTDVAKVTSCLHLTLYNNQVASIPGYRHYVVNSMKALLALD